MAGGNIRERIRSDNMEKGWDYTLQWKEELALLKSIIDKAGLDVAIKWGIEVYTFNGKNVVACHGFKHHFALWFYNGVFLEDREKKLISAEGGNTKALRQWRFTSKEEIDEKLILAYIREAVKNEQEGRSWKPESSGELVIPELLAEAFANNEGLEDAFAQLTSYKQKEYAEHIASAKREATALTRLQKAIPQILKGKGLYDKYK